MTERFDYPRAVPSGKLPENFEVGFEKADSYWEMQKENLYSLFEILGKKNEWSDDIEEILLFIRREWIGKEHGSNGKEEYSEEQIEVAIPILDEMGCTGEIIPPPGYVDQVFIPGGKILALDKRMALVKRLLKKYRIVAGEVVIAAGQRLLIPEDEGSRADLISPGGRFSGEVFSDNSWASRVEERALPLTEYDLARLIMLEKFGKAAVVGASLELHDASGMSKQQVQEMFISTYGKDVPPRVEKDVYFDANFLNADSEEMQRFILINGGPVARKQGEPRPTTLSTTIEWLERTAPQRAAEASKYKVMVLSGNPYTHRSTKEVQLVLDAAGRHDIELIEAGTAATPGDTRKTLYAALGEIGRRLDNEHQAFKSQPEDLIYINPEQAKALRRIGFSSDSNGNLTPINKAQAELLRRIAA